VWYQALVYNESLKVAVSIPGVGQFPALEVSGLPQRPKSGQATGKRQHMPLRLRVYYDQSASPAAVKAALKVGRSFPTMKIRGATLKNVRVKSVQSVPKPQGAHVAISLGDGSTIEPAVEQISFVYERIEW
jgi:type VI protein secretion system component Hcp